MKLTTKALKTALAIGAVASLTAVAVAGTAGSASAATSHTLKVCASGNYTAYAEIPQQGGITTTLIAPGKCGQLSLSNGTTYAKVRGLKNNNPNKEFYVGTAHFSASKGWSGAAKGTSANPSLKSN
jgi:hypothetical protein